jgi:hypothetical protein
LLVDPEFGLQRLLECDRLGRDDMHQRAALRAGKHKRVELPFELGVGARENHAARSAQRLVRRGRDDVRVRHGIRIKARDNQPRHVRDVDEQAIADAVGDRAQARKIEVARIRGEARYDHLRLALERKRRERVVVDQAGGHIEPVLDRVVELAREADLRAVRQTAAMREAHAHDRVARVDQRHVHGGVSLRARMRLHVGVAGVE